ncbi:hypothetical protein YQE_01837, partial [Dendroctonus ponderosae]
MFEFSEFFSDFSVSCVFVWISVFLD